MLGFEFSDEDIGRSHPAARIVAPLDNDDLAQSVAAIAQLAEQLDRTTLSLSLQIVPIERWRTRLAASDPTPLSDPVRSAPEGSVP